MNSQRIAKIVNGRHFGKPSDVNGFAFDSRNIKKGNLFIPLKGSRDGHRFINKAILNGASGFLFKKGNNLNLGSFSIEVSDTLNAFKRIAAFKRSNFGKPVVAITGSVGKTTTKEMIFHSFSPFLNVYRNLKSFNNEIGVAYTLSNITDADLYVQEVGTNRPGEITELESFVKPNIGVVTSVGHAHIEGFKDINGVRTEKLSLLRNCDISILPSSLKEYKPKSITFGEGGDVYLTGRSESFSGTDFEVNAFGERLKGRVDVPGSGVLNAILITLCVARCLNLKLGDVLGEISSFKPPEKRMNIIKLKNLTIVDDCYNANPISMENALNVLSLSSSKRIAIIGDMLELGDISEVSHRMIGLTANSMGIDFLIGFGRNVRYAIDAFKGKSAYFDERSNLLDFIDHYDFSHSTVLVKGSRANGLEDIVRVLLRRYS